MIAPLGQRLYLRIWLAVVAALAVMALLVGWIWKEQVEHDRAQRPGREIIVRNADGNVIGQAAGESGGNAFNWKYTLALPVDGRVYHVNFDDWMFLMNENVMLNRAVMSKFGFRLGEVTLSFRKRTAG